MAEKLVRFKGSRVEILGKNLKNPVALLKKIGILMVAKTQRAFSEQKRGQFSWPERWTPNMPSVLRDLASGPNIKARRFDGRPALVDTGRLRGSISYRQTGKQSIEFGTNVPYARLQQEGGSQSIPITKQIRRNLSLYLKRNRDRSSELGWLFTLSGGGKREALEFTVRARPFVLVDQKDLKEINRMIVEEMRRGK